MVSKEEFRELRKLLPYLDANQWDEVNKLYKACNATKPPASTTNDANRADWILHGIEVLLHKRGLLSAKRHISAVGAREIHPAYEKKSAEARAVLEEGAERPLLLNEKYLLGQIAVETLASRLHSQPHLRVLLYCTHLIPKYFEVAFPDYLANKQVLLVLGTSLINGSERGRTR